MHWNLCRQYSINLLTSSYSQTIYSHGAFKCLKSFKWREILRPSVPIREAINDAHTHPHPLWQSGRLRENLFTARLVPWIWKSWKHDPFPRDNHGGKQRSSSQWKAKARNTLNSEQIAPSANNCYSDEMIFKTMDVTMTKRQYMKPFQCLEKHEMFMTKIYPSYFCSVENGDRASTSTKTYWPLIWI